MDKQEHQQIVESAIAKVLEELFPYGEGRTTRPRVQHALKVIAQKAFSQGESYALLSLLTVRDVAARLQISERRVRAIARQRAHQNIGWQVPGTSTWLFQPDEVELLRPGPSGRPRVASTI